MELKDLVGEHFLSGCEYGTFKINDSNYYHEDANTIDFILDGRKISAIEDPSDGYRSCMMDLIENRKGLEITNTFTPIRVIGAFREDDNDCAEINDVIDFTDCISGKIVLSVGTGNTDDYYPYFVGDFNPENMYLNQ